MILAFSALIALGLPPLPLWKGRAVGTLSAPVIGFARLPGLGRCALTGDGRAWYFAKGKLRQRPAEFGYDPSSASSDFGDIDGDGTDEMVKLESDGVLWDYAWEEGRYRIRDSLRLSKGVVWSDPVLVPNVDRGRAWLLITRGPKTEGDSPPDRLFAFRKVEDRWLRAWDKPLFGKEGLPVQVNWVRWEAVGSGVGLVGTNNGDFPYVRDTVSFRVTSSGLSVTGVDRQKIVEGKRATRDIKRLPGQVGVLQVADALFGESTGLRRVELVEWRSSKIRPLARVPNSAVAWWEPGPGVGYLVDGRTVLAAAGGTR